VGGVSILRVDLRCPSCGFEWHAATIDTESWWGKGLTALTPAKFCYCVRCHHKPPMEVVGRETQGELFMEARA
jgi:hypothetical protein